MSAADHELPPITGFAHEYLKETVDIVGAIQAECLDEIAAGLARVRDGGGRLFVLGVGGSSAHASHAVNDFRKLCGLEAYTPTDNVAELTARINDDGWEGAFAGWLGASHLSASDALLVFSVGGGSRDHGLSVNLVEALELGRRVGTAVYGIVGRDGGYTAEVADACVVIPPLFAPRITPHTEGLCAVLWHLLVSHPALRQQPPTWESVP